MSAVVPFEVPRLRPLTRRDLDRLADIESRAYWSHGWSRGIFEDCLRVGYACWGVEEDARLAGYGILSVAVGESHLLNLAVDPRRQGRGLGRLLLEHTLQAARQWGAECMFLEVRPSNERARALYARAGFTEFGRRRGYYPASRAGGREDALVLCRRL